MKLSDGQRRALELLAKRRCYTGHATYGDMTISGLATKRLVQRGLARYVRGWPVTGKRGGFTVVEITETGKLLSTHDVICDTNDKMVKQELRDRRVNLRLPKRLVHAVEKAAKQERRSFNSMFEVIVNAWAAKRARR